MTILTLRSMLRILRDPRLEDKFQLSGKHTTQVKMTKLQIRQLRVLIFTSQAQNQMQPKTCSEKIQF